MQSMTSGPGRDSSQGGSFSWVVKGFLFLGLVILPLGLIDFTLENLIGELFAVRCQTIREKLTAQSALLAKTARSGYQMKAYVRSLVRRGLVRRSGKDLTRFLDRMEKTYPGAFRWVFWDGEGRVPPVSHPSVLGGSRSWEGAIQLFLNQRKVQTRVPLFKNFSYKMFQEELVKRTYGIQTALGDSIKAEGLLSGWERVVEARWIGQPCLITWDMDVVSYSKDGYPRRIRGGVFLMVFPDKLPPDFWLAMMVQRRPRLKKQLPYPVLAINLRNTSPPLRDPLLPDQEGLVLAAHKAYLERTSDFIEWGTWTGRSAVLDAESPRRLLSLADLKPQFDWRQKQVNRCRIAVGLLFALALAGAGLVQSPRGPSFSLGWRITGLFLIAILLPGVGLIAVGTSFVSSEESRLKDAAWKKMRQGLEILDLRYVDTPRLMERRIFLRLKELIGPSPIKVENVLQAVKKAQEEDLITNYYLSDERGNIALTNRVLTEVENSILQGVKMTMKNIFPQEKAFGSPANLVSGMMSDELQSFLGKESPSILGLTRPSQLRYFCFRDSHLYFMSMQLRIEGSTRILMVQVPVSQLEQMFAQQEFSSNLLAAKGDVSGLTGGELTFYCRVPGGRSIPEESSLWPTLANVFQRAYQLRVNEEGQVTIGGRTFLYAISPLPSMQLKAYIPCFITELGPIQIRSQELKRGIGIMVAVALLVAITLATTLVASLLRPITRIDQAVQEIGRGNLGVVVPALGDDELGRLSEAINGMVKGMRERERMRAYVSDAVLQAVRDDSVSRVIEGEFMEASILFSDIRDFTGLSEHFPPRVIFRMLNEFLGGVEPIIRHNQGWVDKFIGDAVMAVFHEGTPHHALRAVTSAVSTMLFLEEFNQKRTEAGLFPIAIGIGINTGVVMLGDLGSETRKDKTVIGDEVNLASRLETASKQGRHSRIVLSENTYKAVRDLVVAEEMAVTEVRGKAQPVRMFELVEFQGCRPRPGSAGIYLNTHPK